MFVSIVIMNYASHGCFCLNVSGPNALTVSDFIQMVWDQRSSVLVMLTRLVEKGKVGFLPHTLCVVAEFEELCERLKVLLFISILCKLY